MINPKESFLLQSALESENGLELRGRIIFQGGDPQLEELPVRYEIFYITPTGAEVGNTMRGYVVKGQKYQDWINSAAGQGIIQSMIQTIQFLYAGGNNPPESIEIT